MAGLTVNNDYPSLELDLRKPGINTGLTLYFNEGDSGYSQVFTINSDRTYVIGDYKGATTTLHATNIATGETNIYPVATGWNTGVAIGSFNVPNELTAHAGAYECYLNFCTGSDNFSSPRWIYQVISASNGTTVNIPEAAQELLEKEFNTKIDTLRDNIASLSDKIDKSVTIDTSDFVKYDAFNTYKTDTNSEIDGIKSVNNTQDENIQNNSNNITQNTNDISSLKSDMNSVKSDITGIQTTQSNHTSDIAQLKSDFSSVQNTANSNKTDIATTKQDIATINEKLATIGTGSSSSGDTKVPQQVIDDVAQNKADIAKNKTDIKTNSDNIATNTTDIATIKHSLSSDESQISTNTTNISQNEQDIANLKKSSKELSDKVANLPAPDDAALLKLHTIVDTNTHNIADNAQSITTINQKLAKMPTATDLATVTSTATDAKNTATETKQQATDNATNIATLTDKVSKIKQPDLSAYAKKSDLPADNSAQVSKNTTDIATNKTNISQNTTDIANLTNKVNGIHLPDLSPYLKSSDAATTYLTTATASETYAKLTDIPADKSADIAKNKQDIATINDKIKKLVVPDLSSYLTKTAADSTYAKKSDIPDTSNFITTTDADKKYATIQQAYKDNQDALKYTAMMGAKLEQELAPVSDKATQASTQATNNAGDIYDLQKDVEQLKHGSGSTGLQYGGQLSKFGQTVYDETGKKEIIFSDLSGNIYIYDAHNQQLIFLAKGTDLPYVYSVPDYAAVADVAKSSTVSVNIPDYEFPQKFYSAESTNRVYVNANYYDDLFNNWYIDPYTVVNNDNININIVFIGFGCSSSQINMPVPLADKTITATLNYYEDSDFSNEKNVTTSLIVNDDNFNLSNSIDAGKEPISNYKFGLRKAFTFNIKSTNKIYITGVNFSLS